MLPEIKRLGNALLSLKHAGEVHMAQASRRAEKHKETALHLFNLTSADYRIFYTSIDDIQDSVTDFAGVETGDDCGSVKRLALHKQTIALTRGDRLTPIVKRKGRRRRHQ